MMAIGGMVIATSSAFGGDEAPSADLLFQPGHMPAAIIEAEGQWVGPNKIRYEGEMIDDGHLEPRWTVAWDVTATLPNTNGPAVLNGKVWVENIGPATTAYTFKLAVPVCPVSTAPHDIGGLCAVKLTADADGGELVCSGGGFPLWRFEIDDDDAFSLFACPFSLSASGSGSLSTNTQFGHPYPSHPGPPISSSFGVEITFDLTPGEKVEFTNLLVLAPNGEDPGDIPTCTADFNGDGAVNGDDLALLLQAWGTDQFFADLNGDGAVNAADLSIFLKLWAIAQGG
jgi:hypothetical protein